MSCNHISHSFAEAHAVEASRHEVNKKLCVEADGLSFSNLGRQDTKLFHITVKELSAVFEREHVLRMPREFVQCADHALKRTLKTLDREW